MNSREAAAYAKANMGFIPIEELVQFAGAIVKGRDLNKEGLDVGLLTRDGKLIYSIFPSPKPGDPKYKAIRKLNYGLAIKAITKLLVSKEDEKKLRDETRGDKLAGPPVAQPAAQAPTPECYDEHHGFLARDWPCPTCKQTWKEQG